MKTWLIASIMLGLLLIGGFALVSAISNSPGNELTSEENPISCSSCGNGCTAQSNCGLSTCGAISGTGSCGCGR